MNHKDLFLGETALYGRLVKRLDITLAGKHLNLFGFLDLQFRMINNILSHPISLQAVILYPQGLDLEQYFAIFSSLCCYGSNIDENPGNLIDDLSSGDRVKIYGSIGEYLGTEHIDIGQGSVPYANVRFKDLTYKFPLHRMTKLQRYEGTATQLNNFPNRQDVSESDKVIQFLYDKEYVDVSSVSRKGVIICSPRNTLVPYIEDTMVNSVPFSEIYPTGYFTTGSSFFRLPGDIYQRTPMVRLSSNLATVLELLQSDYQTRMVIINASRILHGRLTELEQIVQHCRSNNINLVLLDSLGSDNVAYYKQARFDVSTFDRDVILEITAGNLTSSSIEDTVVDNYLNQHIDLEHVEVPSPECEEAFNTVLKIISYLRSVEVQDASKDEYLSRVSGLYLYYQTLLYPGHYGIGFRGIDVRQQIDSMGQLVFQLIGRVLPGDDYSRLTDLIQKFEVIGHCYGKLNPKSDRLISLVKASPAPTCIIVRKNFQVDILRKYLVEATGRANIEVMTLNQLVTRREIYNEIIFAGWFAKAQSAIFNSGFSKKIKFLLYPHELHTFLKDNRDRFPEYRDYEQQSASIGVELSSGDGQLIDFTSIAKALRDSITNDNETVNRLVSSQCFQFYDDSCAFLTEHYNARVINYLKKEVQSTRPKDLQEGDQLVFLEDDNLTLFNKVIENFKKLHPDQGRLYDRNVMYSKLWRTALVRYMTQNNFGPKSVAKQLRKHGCTRVWQTVEGWLKDKQIISPMPDAVAAIAKMTGDNNLNQHYQRCLKASTSLKSFHKTLRTRIFNNVAKAFIFKDDIEKFDPLLRDFVSELPSYGRLVMISQKSEDVVQVPMNFANKVIDQNM